MSGGISVAAAIHRVVAIIDAAKIAGRRESSSQIIDGARNRVAGGQSRISATWERGRGAMARLHVSFEDEGVSCRVDVGAETTMLTPAAARTAAVLHAEVADLALWLEHELADVVVDRGNLGG